MFGFAVRALCDVVQVIPLGETVEAGDAVLVLRQPRFWGTLP
jgi:ABC-type microcin C transport system duplicated ATPase subunit YejF